MGTRRYGQDQRHEPRLPSIPRDKPIHGLGLPQTAIRRPRTAKFAGMSNSTVDAGFPADRFRRPITKFCLARIRGQGFDARANWVSCDDPGLMSRALLIAFAVFAAGLLSHPPVADAQSRYDVSRMGEVVTLSDTRTALVVRVLTPASNAYQMTVKGEDVIRRTWNTLDDIRGQLGLNGVPLLWPYANRLDEQAFYANGQKYSFDPGLGNTGRGAIPIHGFVTGADAWKVVEAKARREIGVDDDRSWSSSGSRAT